MPTSITLLSVGQLTGQGVSARAVSCRPPALESAISRIDSRLLSTGAEIPKARTPFRGLGRPAQVLAHAEVQEQAGELESNAPCPGRRGRGPGLRIRFLPSNMYFAPAVAWRSPVRLWNRLVLPAPLGSMVGLVCDGCNLVVKRH